MRPILSITIAAGVLAATGACGDRPAATAPLADVAIEAPGPAPDGMVWIPGGVFLMGGDGPHAEPVERPVHAVVIDGVYMDVRPITNARFRVFVEATHYVTVAERPVDAQQILSQVPPGTPPPPPEMLVPGSLVFTPNPGAKNLENWSQWWRWTPGANWRHPSGPGSTIEGQDDHPVVQVAWEDAVAFAGWAGARLPTEAEWERAARGGVAGAEYAWGHAPFDPAHPQAHIYAGDFPTRAASTQRAGALAPNGYGLFDMSGNVWQWTQDWYRADAYRRDHARGTVRNPTGPAEGDHPIDAVAGKVLRGGSFLCSDAYCRGYRVSARSSAAPDSGASHVGFRTVMTVAQWRQKHGGVR